MPQVPVLETTSVQAEPLPGRAYPRVDTDVNAGDYGAGLAHGLDEVAAAGVQQQAKLKDENDKLRVVDSITQINAARDRLLYGTPGPDGKNVGGAYSLHGVNAINMPATLLPQYDEVAQKIASALTPDQQRLLQPHIANVKGELNTQLNRYEYEESNRLADAVFSNGIKQTISSASVGWRDPDAINKSRLDLKGLVQMQGDREGWSDDQRQQALSTAQAQMHFNVVDRMLADDAPQQALKYFNEIKDTNELTGEQAKQLGAQIDAHIKEDQSELKRTIADKYQDSMTAARYGLANPSTVSKDDLKILYPYDYQRHWDGLQQTIATGAQAKEFDHMTPDQIGAALESKRPTQGGPEAAFQISNYETLSRAAEQSIKERYQDPAQFAVDTKHWTPIDFSNPTNAMGQIRSRANTQEQVAESLGVSTPLLSKDEARQFSAQLANQPPAQRMDTLTSLRGVLFDNAYNAVLKQIAPNSPLTAIAGTTLDRPSKGQTPVWYDPKFAASPRVGQDILEGEQILQDKSEKGIKAKFPMPEDKDLQTQFMGAIGGTNSDLFRGRDQTYLAYYQAFKAAYAAEANRAGLSSGILNSDLAKKAAEEVIGDVTTYGHSTVRVPAGMDPSRFEGQVNQASQTALKASGYNDADISALRGYGLRELGDTLGTGRYVIINGRGDPLKSKDGGKTVVIDLNQQMTGQPAAAVPPIRPFAGKGGGTIMLGGANAP